MAKEKIALVAIRYGKDINGGAEYHCRMLAERLVDDYDVEVFTTCVRNYNTGMNELPEGEENINCLLYTSPSPPRLIRKSISCILKKKKLRESGGAFCFVSEF